MSWESGLQDGGVSESFTHKMAAWEFCLQDGGVSESLKYILRLQWVRRSPSAPLKLFFAPPLLARLWRRRCVNYSQLRPRLVSAFPPVTLQFFYSNKILILAYIIFGARTPRTACFGSGAYTRTCTMHVPTTLYRTSAPHNSFWKCVYYLRIIITCTKT